MPKEKEMLSVCMIVKNEAENLKLTLPQVVKYASEVIVVDTGSTDNTVEVAKDLGAKVYHFTWINDFAAARNYSLSLATQPWILWLDADEYLKPENLEKMIEVLKKTPEDVAAHQLIITESPYGETRRGASYARVKLFRNFRGIHFERPINEQVVDKEGKVVQGEVIPVIIWHWGKYLNEAKMREKKERYFNLYGKHLDKNPSDPYVNFLLGNLLREEGRLAEAYAAFEKTVENCKGDSKIKIDALTRQAEIALKLGKYKQALQAANQVIKDAPDDIGAKNILATLLIGVGKGDLAIQVLEEAIKPVDFQAVDPMREKVIPRTVLAKAYRDKRDFDKAELYEEEAKELKERINAHSAK